MEVRFSLGGLILIYGVLIGGDDLVSWLCSFCVLTCLVVGVCWWFGCGFAGFVVVSLVVIAGGSVARILFGVVWTDLVVILGGLDRFGWLVRGLGG